MFILKYFKSLSARLLVLTLLWVSFVSGSIAWTMLVNWELEASASAKYAVGELRLHAYRAAYFSQTGSSRLDFDKELQAMLDGFKNVRSGDSWKPLLLPREPDIADKLDLLEGRWRGSIEPMFVRARELGKPVDEYALSGFLDEATNLAHRIEEWRSGYLWQLRYLQMLLIVLAIGSLFAIMLLLWRWVIRPSMNSAKASTDSPAEI